MSATQVWTIKRLLEWTTDYLRSQGSESPRLEAEVLLAHARGCQRIDLYTSFSCEPAEEERSRFRELVRRRAEGMPVAYLVGHKEFYSLDFRVASDCLIPRPETEHLVVSALDWARKRSRSASQPLRIVDVGTGSGCVAISLAKHLPDCQIYALDISSKALQLAARNIADHQLENRIILCEGDLLAALPGDLLAVDLIVSNPPYVSPAEYSQLPRDVRDFEPKLALVSEDEGMEISLRLLEQAEQSLGSDGAIMLESSPMLVPRLEQCLQARVGWRLLPTVKDLHGHPRIVAAERPAANHP